MKKTISALLIAVLLITLAVSPVLGEESFPLTVMALDDKLQEHWAEMPGVESVKDLCFNPHSKIEDADFFRLYEDGLSIKEAREKGIIDSFEPGETLLKDLDTLPPIFGNILKSYLITEDGRMWGVRGDIQVKTPLFWIPDAWNASPFADRTPPSSFTELLDFLEVYLATPHEGFELLYNFAGEKNYAERTIVLMLLDSWFYQSVHAGEPARYNSPELVALLERTDRIIRELKKQEPVKKKDQKDLRPLFSDQDNGKDFLSRDPYTWDNMIPYRIDASQDPLIYVESRTICVRKDSPFASRASDFLEWVIVDEGEGEKQYSHPDQMDVDAYNQKYQKYFPEIKDGFLSQEMVDSILRINAVPVFNVGLGDYGEDVAFISLLKEFLSGKLSPQKFIDKLEKNRAEE